MTTARCHPPTALAGGVGSVPMTARGQGRQRRGSLLRAEKPYPNPVANMACAHSSATT